MSFGDRMIFEIVSEKYRKFPNQEIKLPTRKTKFSAGYDFFSNETYTLKQNETHIFWTDIKADLIPSIYLQISIRSSLSLKRIRLANSIGIIDADYYNNESNDGNIGFILINDSKTPYTIKKGDRIGQGILLEYFTMDEDKVEEERTGGFGSTDVC